ncbi:MAG TPA: hypothetical protein VN132_10245 [Bdellovibrio sp.]|nr:hypothetical protein [Bdellovibrio sp.]
MKTKTQIIFAAIFALSFSSQAAEVVTSLEGVIQQRCSIKVSNKEESVTYQNFTSAVNTFKSIYGSVPAWQRYKVEGDSPRKTINLNTHSTIQTATSTYSNCMSLTLASNPVFAQAAEAEAYLLKVGDSLIDVCWINYDGSVGLSKKVTKVGKDGSGKDIFQEGPEHSLRQLPGIEINLAKRSIVRDGAGERLSLNGTDLLTKRASLVIEGDGVISQEIGDLSLEVICSTQEKSQLDK